MDRILLLCALASVIQAYKMVLFVPSLGHSQVIFNHRVAEVLINGGHDVTFILIKIFSDLDESIIKLDHKLKLHSVNASGTITFSDLEEMKGDVIYEDASFFFDERNQAQVAVMLNLFQSTCERLLENKDLLNFLKNEKFDLAFVHMFDACQIGLVHAAGIPSWVWLNTGGLMDYIADLVNSPIIPSFMPTMMMDADDSMGIIDRTKSFLGHQITRFVWQNQIAEKQTALFRKHLAPDFPSLVELARKCPLVMANTNDLYDLPRPTLAKVINIGGVGAQLKDAKPLPKEFDEIVGVGKGVVVMSFGSIAPISKMPKHFKDAFIGAFEKLKDYQFVIRYDGDDLNSDLPKNVHLFNWLPQSDLLQHEKTKAFITHCGYNGLQEAINTGRPMVTLPLFGDQFRNSKIAEKHGVAVRLEKSTMSEDTVYDALNRVLSEDSFAKNALRLKNMVKMQPIPPEALLLRWAEFAAEFKTLDNLRPASEKLNLVQYYSIDVLALLFGVVLLILFVCFKAILALCSLFRAGKKKID